MTAPEWHRLHDNCPYCHGGQVMTDTPRQPATAAGRALRDEFRGRTPWRIHGTADLDARIVAIEAEAAAGLLALREALDVAASALEVVGVREAADTNAVALRATNVAAQMRKALDDTAPAAAEIEARIEKRVRAKGQCYDPAHMSSEQQDAIREQPATDEATE